MNANLHGYCMRLYQAGGTRAAAERIVGQIAADPVFAAAMLAECGADLLLTYYRERFDTGIARAVKRLRVPGDLVPEQPQHTTSTVGQAGIDVSPVRPTPIPRWASFWDAHVSVGSSGARKRFGDFAVSDTRALANDLTRKGATLSVMGRLFQRIADSQKAGETLEKAAARLSAHQRDKLSEYARRVARLPREVVAA